MANFGSPVPPPQVNPSIGIQTLSGLLGLKQQQQALQIGEAQISQQQQQASELKQAQGILQQVSQGGYRDKNGNLDSQKLSTDISAIGPFAGAAAANIINVGNGIVANQKAMQDLTEESRSQLGQMISSLSSNPNTTKADVSNALVNWIADHANDPNARRIGATGMQMISQLPEGPQLRSALSNIGGQLDKASQSTPATLDVGATVQPGQVLNATGEFTPGGKPITKTIPPARMPYTDPFGRVYNFNPQTGSYEPAQGGNKGGPGASAPGDVQAVTAQANQNFEQVNANRMAGNIAPQQLDQIRNALELSAKTSTGGSWTAARAQIESNLSSLMPGLQGAQNDAAKVQILDKFLTRITNDASKVLGPQATTDAMRDSIAHQNAQIGYTPQAIHAVLKYAEAQTEAMKAKADAQDAWLQRPGNGITNEHEFENQWRNAYDPVLFQLEVGSPEEQKKLIESLPPAEAASLAAKRKALQELGVTLR